MTPPRAWACLAASFVIALAAILRMAGPASDEHHASGVIRLPGLVTAAIVTLFGLAVGVFAVDLVRRAVSREKPEGEGERAEEAARVPPWLRKLTLILSMINAVVLAYLWRRVVPGNGLLSWSGGLTSGLALPRMDPVSAPAVFNWVFGILAVAAGLGALGMALWVALADRPAREREGAAAGEVPAGPLEAAVEESLEDLRAEVDPRRAIVRCYARFERAAAGSGLEREPWLTPKEFMHEVLARLPVPRAAVPTLTGLFEVARFSHHAVGPRERDRALDALAQIRRAMEVRDGDARAH